MKNLHRSCQFLFVLLKTCFPLFYYYSLGDIANLHLDEKEFKQVVIDTHRAVRESSGTWREYANVGWSVCIFHLQVCVIPVNY